MKKKQGKRIKAKAGITLIALIITVIVMLILAGVTISLTIGDNGIFKKSQEGAQVYKNSANNEANSLNRIDQEMGDLLNQYNGGSSGDSPAASPIEPTPPIVPSEKPGKPDSNGIYTENSTINGEEGNAFNPEIPKGFKPKNEGTANWGNGTTEPSEEAVKEGLIIEDVEGNQFVWVAVDGNDVKLGRYVFTETGEIDTTRSKTEPSDQLKTTSSDSDYYTEGLKDDTTGNTHAKNIEAFRSSVETHGGYYIARYEASYGVDGKPNSKISTSFTTKNGEVNAPTVEGQLWNNITQPDAAERCSRMYDSSTYGVTSDLVNSYAWDTAIVFIQKYSGDADYSRQGGDTINSSITNTGVNGDEKCHIQDIAGNCWEWTTETYSDTYAPCTGRGGIYRSRENYTSGRSNDTTSGAYQNNSFRAILYL